MAEYLLIKCRCCGLAVSRLSQCELCGRLICDDCLDPFVGACNECTMELFNNYMKCGICGLKKHTDDLKRCSPCGRMVCKSHISDVCIECVNMYGEYGEDSSYCQDEDEPYFQDEDDFNNIIETLGDYNILLYLHDQHEVQEY